MYVLYMYMYVLYMYMYMYVLYMYMYMYVLYMYMYALYMYRYVCTLSEDCRVGISLGTTIECRTWLLWGVGSSADVQWRAH